MNAQEAFNKVWQHTIVENNPKSPNFGGDCYYRAGDKKCFIGVLIPDSVYDPEMEHKSINYLMHNFPQINSLFKDTDTLFLSRLQSIHDSWFDEREEKLRNLAKDYELTVPTS